ncbi:MAG TPA: hypothetical protein VGZ02_00840 [Candidatus Baltobacteraceae bacterium]|nr:hypothetical protein [Candidatus Baltobacteraceae bacterium]
MTRQKNGITTYRKMEPHDQAEAPLRERIRQLGTDVQRVRRAIRDELEWRDRVFHTFDDAEDEAS